MDSNRSAHRRKTGHFGLQFLADGMHQICKLIDHDHDVGKLFPGKVVRCNLFIVADDISNIQSSKKIVSSLHLEETEIKRLERPLRIGYDRSEQVRDSVIDIELDDLGIDQDHPHLFGSPPIEYGADQTVDAHAFSASRRSGDQQVG